MKSDISKRKKINSKYKVMEKNWNERFILEKIPQYDAYKDVNYLSLGLIKSKLRYEERQVKESQKKNKKLKNDSSYHTLNTKPKKNIYSPILTTLKENENIDLFSLKLSKRPLTIKRKKLNKTIEFNIKEKKDDNNQYIKTYENKNIHNNKQNINENKDKDSIVIDKDLSDKLNEIKELWDNLGVTPEYQIFFGEMLDKLKSREIIEKYISYEKKQLNQFKSDLEKLMNDIYKRENDLNNLKKIEEIYSKNEQLNQYNYLKNKKIQENKMKNAKDRNNIFKGKIEDDISLYKNINKNVNEYDNDNIEKSKDFDEEISKYKLNKEKIENDIDSCLKLLRLHTINIVNQFTKFRINYNFFFTSGRNDVNQMKNGYEFDYNYLLKIKKDCEYFKKCSLKNIYNFSNDCENDPFFLNLLNNNKDNKNNNDNEYKYLTATEDTINSIKECMFILDQEEMYFKISQNQKIGNNNNINDNNDKNENNESTNDNNSSNLKNKKNTIGNNFQGNLENAISKLKNQNEYKNLFFNSAEIKEPFHNNNNNIDKNIDDKIGQGPKKIPETSSKDLFKSFQIYDKIKNNIYNKEEIQNIKNNMYKNNNKIIIYSKNINENKENFSNKENNNFDFNHIYKINEKCNSLKINLNNINGINKKNNNNGEKKRKNIDLNIKLNNKTNNINKQKENENKKQDNNNININNKENDFININDKNLKINTITNNDNNNNNDDDHIINLKSISILSLIDKQNSVNEDNGNKNRNFNIGKYLFKNMNPFNLNLLINSLKNNNKYSITNSNNSIISSSPEEIKDIFNYIKDQNNYISNINELENILKEKDIYLSDDNNNSQLKYAFISSIININFNSVISSSIIYNKYKYNGIKINSSKNIIYIEDEIILYTIPTNDNNILIYICLFNEKIKEIIKKYDKNNNIFNGFSTFVNIISLYFEENDNNNNDKEKMMWIPCFEIDTQLICSKISGYNKININNNNENKSVEILEYDEIVKIKLKPEMKDFKNENKDVNLTEDIIIENEFIFGLYHKEMKKKYNSPFIFLASIGKDNFIKGNN